MPSYKVLEVAPSGEPWGNDHGTFQTYRLRLEGQDKSAHLNQKAGSTPPQVGASLDLELSPHPRFEDALKAKKVFAGASGGGGGGGRPRDPAERRSIQMQHAQKCAVDALRLACEKGDYVPPTAGDVASHVKAIAAVLYAQVEEAAA